MNHHPDMPAMEAIYNAWDGANWRDNGHWLTDTPLGEWYGVTINSSSRVSGLELSDNYLTGQVTAELARLTNLRTLILFGNQLTGQISAELAQLTNLRELALAGNALTGPIPQSWRNSPTWRSWTLA